MESGESPHFLTLFFPFTEEENSGQNGDKSSVGPAGPPADHFSQLRHVQGDEILEQCGLCGPGSQDSLQVRMSISAELFIWRLKVSLILLRIFPLYFHFTCR